MPSLSDDFWVSIINSPAMYLSSQFIGSSTWKGHLVVGRGGCSYFERSDDRSLSLEKWSLICGSVGVVRGVRMRVGKLQDCADCCSVFTHLQLFGQFWVLPPSEPDGKKPAERSTTVVLLVLYYSRSIGGKTRGPWFSQIFRLMSFGFPGFSNEWGCDIIILHVAKKAAQILYYIHSSWIAQPL